MPLKWIVSAFLVTACTGVVTLQRELGAKQNFAHCGEQVTIICTANRTNFITIFVDGYGSHTFERNSEKQAILGPFNLNLTKADVDPVNFYLTTFEVTSVTNQKYFVEIPRINCSDVQSSDSLYVRIKSDLCPQQGVEYTLSNELLLQWETPVCSGWKNLISHYSIHIYTTEEVRTLHCGNDTEFLVTNASSVTRVNITATNLCMETIVIKTYVKIDAGSQASFGALQLGVVAGVTSLIILLTVIPIVLTVLIVCCCSHKGTYVLGDDDETRKFKNPMFEKESFDESENN